MLLHLGPVAQEGIYILVGIVELVHLISGRLCQFVHRPGDQVRLIALPLKVFAEILLLNIRIAFPVLPVAQVGVGKPILIGKKLHYPVLGFSFNLSYASHISLILPVKSSCIMPCLIALHFSSFCSSASISESMSNNTFAIASCSSYLFGINNTKFSTSLCDKCFTVVAEVLL